MKRLLIFSVLTIAAVLVFSAFFPSASENLIYDDVLRFHVIANSDSDFDQTLKMSVRDFVFEEFAEDFAKCKSIEEAQTTAQKLCPDIERAVNEFLTGKCDYNVVVKCSREEYPTRVYGDFCLPCGEYMSMRLVLGEGAGKNFWCVLFPPMCLSAALDDKECEEYGLTEEEYKLISRDGVRYKIKFRILELIKEYIG